jgi:hypothetical protein
MSKSNNTQAAPVAQNYSYAQYLLQSPSERLEEEVQYCVQQKKSEWEVSISKTRADLAKAKRNLNNALANANLQGVIDYTNTVRGLESGLEVATAAFSQLFPVEVA